MGFRRRSRRRGLIVGAAIGASAGMVIPRAVVRDLAEGHAAAVLMSRLALVMGAAPILAPLLEIIRAPEFQAEIDALGGYDVAEMGRVVWES